MALLFMKWIFFNFLHEDLGFFIQVSYKLYIQLFAEQSFLKSVYFNFKYTYDNRGIS